MLLCREEFHLKAKLIYLSILSLFCAQGALAQDDIDTTLTPKKPVIFRDKKNHDLKYRRTVGAYQLRSNGWSIGGNYIISDKKNDAPNYTSFTVYHVSIGFTRSAKEGAVVSPFGETVKYGKINSLYPIELSIGKRKSIARAAVHKGVEIQWEYRGGLILGWLLPYRINTAYGEIEEYNPATRFAYEDFDNIYIGVGSFRGLRFQNFTPGFIVESNILFNYALRKRLLVSPSVGASLSYYTQSIPLLFTESSGPLFVEIHVGVELGKFKIK